MDAFAKWFQEQLEPFARSSYPLELDSWRREFNLIRDLIEKPDRVRIALVGTTGAGKSTFLNAVLGQEILPVGVMHPCTAFVTGVSYSPEKNYNITVQFCTSQEWQSDVESLIVALQPGESDDDGEGRTESKRLIEATKKRVRAVYGFDGDFDPEDILDAKLPSSVREIFAKGSSETRRFSEPKEMLSYLRKLIHGENSLWPLVKEVDITGPYDCLAGGLEVVDLPGLNDPNEARVEVTREFLRTSPFVWVIFSMVRGLTEDIHRTLQEEKLLRTLVLSGTYNTLSLIGTKADEIDANMASQLGLPEDCDLIDLIRAYRLQTVDAVRDQLEQMVRGLASPSDEGATLERMVDIARQVKVHTTSSSGYNKLKKIGRLLKDYGINDETETGIPGVHDHFRQIGKEAGLTFKSQTAVMRLEQLRKEIDFFFRARNSEGSADIADASERFTRELDAFIGNVENIQGQANDQLSFYRDRFLEKLDPLLAASVKGVEKVTQEWQSIHWASLRAIVQRNGIFRSPSTGRSFDFNEDLSEPLLGKLPVAWEEYFTEDLGQITKEFVIKVTESGKNFCDRIRLIVELLFKRTDTRVDSQLAWFKDKVSSLAKMSTTTVLDAIRERRSELAAKIPLVAKDLMKSAYEGAKTESGTGMKRRMLDQHLEPQAHKSAQPLYSTIRQDLLVGLNNLEVIIIGLLRDLSLNAKQHAETIINNAGVDIGERPLNPRIKVLLDSMPNALDR